MARKKKHEEHVNHERWLVSYADFITLLFAFFVILYALSEVDKNKLKKFSQSVQFAFSHVGTGGTQTQGKNAATLKPNVIGQAWPMGRRESDPGPFEGLSAVVNYLEHTIARHFLREERAHVEVVDNGKGVVVRLPAERLFARRSAVLRPDRTNFLHDFGAVVSQHNVRFEIEAEVRVPKRGALIDEHGLGCRRNESLVTALRSGVGEARDRFYSGVYALHDEGVMTSDAEHSRSMYEFRVVP